MESSKNNYDEVFSSDFSEISESESSEHSSIDERNLDQDLEGEIDFIPENVTRDFWVKKEILPKSKKGRGRKGKEIEKKKSDKKLQEIARREREKVRKYNPREVVLKLAKIPSARAKNKIEQQKIVNAFLEIFARADFFPSKLLVSLHLLESISTAFKLYDNDESWKAIWKQSLDLLDEILPHLVDENENVVKEYEEIALLIGETEKVEKTEDTEEDVDLSTVSTKQMSILKSKLTAVYLFNSIGSFSYVLNDAFLMYWDKQPFYDEKAEEMEKQLIETLKKVKKTFVATGEEKNILRMTALLLQTLYQRPLEKDENLSIEQNESAEKFINGLAFSPEGFSNDTVQDLALYIVLNNEDNFDKIEALLELSIFWSLRKEYTKAKALLSLSNTKLTDLGEERRWLKILTNRAQTTFAMCCFFCGHFQQCAQICETIIAAGNFPENVGQNRNSGIKKFPSTFFISFDTFKVCRYFSATFEEAIRLTLLNEPNGLYEKPLYPTFDDSFQNYQRNALTGSKESPKGIAFACLDIILRGKWRKAVELLSMVKVHLSDEAFGAVEEKLKAEIKKAALEVFCIRYRRQFGKISFSRLAERFELAEGVVDGVVTKMVSKKGLEGCIVENEGEEKYLLSKEGKLCRLDRAHKTLEAYIRKEVVV